MVECESDVNIVVSAYNKNVDFVYKITNNNTNINVMIYYKEQPDKVFNVPINKGNEASVYLKYIIDFYTNKKNIVVFHVVIYVYVIHVKKKLKQNVQFVIKHLII